MRRPLPAFLTFSAGSLSVVLSLFLVLLLSAFLGFHDLGHSPSGLHVDEASNVWNTWCLLKTGRDAAGERWPVFYFRSFGENRSALMLYALLPFEAMGGRSVVAARAVGATAGVAAVFCMFAVGRRLFDAPTGLLAALFLAVSPWHVQQSRSAHEATLVPLLVLFPLFLLLASRVMGETGEPGDSSKGKMGPRPALALLAGLLAGACCYGYPAVRIFLPLLLLSILVVAASGLARLACRGERRRALLLFLLGALLSFGPLVFKHLTDPEIGKRGTTTWVWEADDGFGDKAAKVLARYPGHFSLDFLFANGGSRIHLLARPSGYGLLFWWMLPLILIGLMGTVLRMKRSPPARLVLLWLLLYPTADLLNRNEGMSVLRSLPGLPVFGLLAAVGAMQAFQWLATRRVSLSRGVAGLFFLGIAISGGLFFREYFGQHDHLWDRYRYFAFQNDLLAAGEWLRPRFEGADAVVVTTLGMTHPYVSMLLSLGYDPARWLADEKTIVSGPLPNGSYDHEDVVTRFGKVQFLYVGLPMPPALSGHAPPGRRTIFIVRPGQLSLEKLRPPDFEVRTPWGKPILWCFDVER